METLKISQDTLTEAVEQLHSIRDFIRFVVSALRENEVHLGQGTEDYFAEATALVMQSLSLDWSADEQILDSRLLTSENKRIIELLAQRINSRIPLGYLVNLAYFCGQPYYVDERVLIPRSPIAELINQRFLPYCTDGQIDPNTPVNNGLPSLPQPFMPERILDLCTGSGCIAVALAYAFVDATVDAVDLSRDALSVASINVSPGRMSPRSSARRIIDSAGRSFTEPAGLLPSSLPKTTLPRAALSLAPMRCKATRGVLPTASSIVGYFMRPTVP